jgi:hypothetical protein
MNLRQALKAHVDNGGDLHSVPTRLFNDLLATDQRFRPEDLELMYMFVYQKRKYNKKENRVTSLSQWFATFEWEPLCPRSDGETMEDFESETQREIEARAKERERWRRIAEPSPSPEVDDRMRKR